MSSHRPDPALVASLTMAKRGVLAAIIAIASSVLLGWAFQPLQGLAPDFWFRMVAYTALSLLMAAASFKLTGVGQSSKSMLWGQILAATVFFYASATLLEYATGTYWGHDHWLPHRPATFPGRPAPPTLIALVLISSALLLCRQYDNAAAKMADLCVALLILLSVYLISAYLYGAVEFVGIDPSTLTAPNTVFCIAAFAFCLSARRASAGSVFSYLVDVGIGGQAIRTVLPIILIIPMLGFVAVGYVISRDIIVAPLARALVASVEVFLLMWVVIWLTRRINLLESELRSMSLLDHLTGLSNRRGFYLLGTSLLEQVKRRGTSVSVLFFDLDGLKKTNDTHGHEIGSQFIAEFSSLLRINFRSADILARVGGDEFAVVTESKNFEVALQRLTEAAEAVNQLPSKAYSLCYSVGVASLNPDSSESFEDLVRRADAKMYEEKNAKKALKKKSGDT